MPPERLALLGGDPALPAPLPPYRSIGAEEVEAVRWVAASGCLSGFYGSPGEQFLGGPMVRAFEDAWRARFRTGHAVSVNSATSGLFAAVGAAGVGPGDEVVVPPTTMSATAMAPLVYGAVPVFADIEDATFCLDPERVRDAITPRTRAILAVNLFGHPAHLRELRELADERGLVLIEDNAQGPLAQEGARLAGTIGHMGVFSLNYHKHIHTGEGGMVVTDDDRLALRLRLIRNHGENAVEHHGIDDLANLVGFNYRLTELSAAVGLEQLRKADARVAERERLAQGLSEAVQGLEGFVPPAVRPGCRHVYYVWAMRVRAQELGVSRAVLSRALEAENFPHGTGYVRPLYLLPLFQRRIALGRSGFPLAGAAARYEPGTCPVAERLWKHEFLTFETCMHGVDGQAAKALAAALQKVHAHRRELARWGAQHPEVA